VGYKPSFGMLSRSGMKMGAESLDTVGIIARSVENAALLAAGSGMRPDLAKVEPLRNPRLGVCRSPNWHHMSREGAEHFEATVKQLAARGASTVEKEIPFGELDNAAATILVYEMARGLAYEVANHRARVSPMLLERVDAGAAMTYDQYAKALAYAADCRRRMLSICADIDAIVTPSATGEAPLGLESTGNTAMNRLWTLLYGPCVTVPAGEGPAGMPLGVQVVGLPGNDGRTLAIARWAEMVFK
jgi:Asp-tRNA(Asn)/Glu-tRNA(Gln) amidotransferase A subunit family amidase